MGERLWVLRKNMSKTFRAMDADKSGGIDEHEFNDMLDRWGFNDMDQKARHEIFVWFDDDNDGFIDLVELATKVQQYVYGNPLDHSDVAKDLFEQRHVQTIFGSHKREAYKDYKTRTTD